MAAGQAVKVQSKTSTKGVAAQAIKNGVSTSQLVNQKQSQELVQTLVHGSVRRLQLRFKSSVLTISADQLHCILEVLHSPLTHCSSVLTDGFH